MNIFQMKIKRPKTKHVKKAFLIVTYSFVVVVMVAGMFQQAALR